jgi:hypothetical protein
LIEAAQAETFEASEKRTMAGASGIRRRVCFAKPARKTSFTL